MPIFGCASFYPGGFNRPMPHADTLPAGEPGYEMFERQLLSVKRLLDLGLIRHWGLSTPSCPILVCPARGFCWARVDRSCDKFLPFGLSHPFSPPHVPWRDLRLRWLI